MSRHKERLEKNCLNCGAEVLGRYCQRCGQENVDTRESVWDLVSHFFKDITHFDGKFFSTLKYLFTKPGFLSNEYLIGRRASYANPVRMYIFTSAFFFLIFFSFMHIDRRINVSGSTIEKKTPAQIANMDSVEFNTYAKTFNEELGRKTPPMTKLELISYMDSSFSTSGFHLFSKKYKSRTEYDSLLNLKEVNHSWLQRKFQYKEFDVNERFNNNKSEMLKAFGNMLFHSLPQMFFISLPFFAFILQLLYIRQKKYLYVNHGIFSIHFYIFTFMAMLIMFGLAKLNETLGWGFITFLDVMIGFGILFYLYKSMRRFYQQRRAKTVVKFLLFCLVFFVVTILLFAILVLFSLFNI